MKAAELLILAYKSYKKGLIPIATQIFAQAMEDESAPALIELIFKDVNVAQEEDTEEIDDDSTSEEIDEDVEVEDVEVEDVEVEDVEVEVEDVEVEDVEVEESESESETELADILNETQIAQLKAIANTISSTDKAPGLSKKIITILTKKIS